jgi:hypothetical protein
MLSIVGPFIPEGSCEPTPKRTRSANRGIRHDVDAHRRSAGLVADMIAPARPARPAPSGARRRRRTLAYGGSTR